MAYKSILALAITLEADEPALTAAGELASRLGARAGALIVTVHLASHYSDTQHKLSDVLADIAKGPASESLREQAEIRAWLDAAAHDFDVRNLDVHGAATEHQAVAHARLADLICLTHARSHGLLRRTLLEDILFKSGRPVLLMPEDKARGREWRRAVIGWNGSAQAVRALAGALPLLQHCEAVVIATVDANRDVAVAGKKPGEDVAAYLASHGVKADVRNLDSMGRSDARALVDEAVAIDADLLVLGAYGHSRAQERIFGGVTRELLEAAPLPLLLAH